MKTENIKEEIIQVRIGTVRNLLLSREKATKERLRKEIEKKRGFTEREFLEKLSKGTRIRVEQRDIGYNQAIDEIISILI